MRPVRLAAAVLTLVCAVSGLTVTGPAAGTATAADDPRCPIAKASPPVTAPPRPTPPTTEDTEDPVGGERMGSDGLVLPGNSPAALPKSLNAHAWVLADLDSGEVLAACAPHALHAPASTLKLLTALTALPRVKPDQVVTVTAGDLAFESGSSAVGLVEGGRYRLETVLLGLMLVSGNDAANVLARLIGGDSGVKGGLAAMNATAAKLGANDTHAVTPSGLDGPGQWTSAYDLALIARADFARADFRKYTATKSAQIPPQQPNVQPPRKYAGFQIQNDNKLLYNYPGAIGGKTGFTDQARHTFVGAATRNGRRLVVTMLDGEHRPEPLWKQAAGLLDWGFALPAAAEPVGRLVNGANDAPAAERTRNPDAARADAVPPAGTEEGPSAYFVGAGVVGVSLLVVGVGLLRARQVRARSARRRRSARLPHPVGPGTPPRPPRREPDRGPSGPRPRPAGRPPHRYGGSSSRPNRPRQPDGPR
ncbi:D-alanyl-D-alanine carboxypeptidase family protein [Cryptosporangium minutisporangium]|uniref:D-alanyl-D-alanine carboxypeptidase family protein n=1 Tax=Cryptosporangium minutisporangium TaxID=113569 RepID=UPI0031E5F95B